MKVVVGQPLELEAQIRAFPAPEIKWYKDGLAVRPSQAVNFLNQPNGVIGLSFEKIRPEDAGVYTLEISNRLGDLKGAAIVEVEPKGTKPVFINDLQDTKVVDGFPVKFGVKVSGYPLPTLKWEHEGNEIRPGNEHCKVSELSEDGTAYLTIDKVASGDAGKYQVTATNTNGQTASLARLNILPSVDETIPEEPPKFLSPMRDETADEGKELSLSAPFIGNPIPEVFWTKNGEPITPSERVIITCDGKRVGLSINPAEVPDSGAYSCLLANPLGETESKCDVSVRKLYQKPNFLTR